MLLRLLNLLVYLLGRLLQKLLLLGRLLQKLLLLLLLLLVLLLLLGDFQHHVA